MAIQDNGTVDSWDLLGALSPQGAINILDRVSPYLNIQKNCGTDNECNPDTYLWLNPTVTEGMSFKAKAILSDGSLLFVFVRYPLCDNVSGDNLLLKNTCGDAEVDINGFKPPNQRGKDLFSFHITKNGIIPIGAANDYSDFSDCLNHGVGRSCAAWVIYNENMDYLKCSDLSWSGKRKCG